MYLVLKFGGHESYGNWYIQFLNQFLHDYRGKTELISSDRHIERFSKSGIPIYLKACRKIRRAQSIAKRSAFHASAINEGCENFPKK